MAVHTIPASGSVTIQAERVRRGRLYFAIGRSRGYDLATGVLLGIIFVLILATFRDYGITWDEPIQRYYGRLIDRYYAFLIRGHFDPSATINDPSSNISLYGGLFD